MKLSEFYRSVVQAGMDNDPRGRQAIDKELASRKKRFDSLSEKDKRYFDVETLANPYSDSRILAGSGEEEVKKLLVGIDVDAGEIAVCDRLNQKGAGIDLVMAHHPSGRALAALAGVMGMQSDMLMAAGVPIAVAEDLMDSRIKEVERRMMPTNHNRAPDAARLLGIPLVCTHTPADNMVSGFLENLFKTREPYLLQDLLDLLMEIPEYQEAVRNNAGPRIILGNKDRRAGKVVLEMTGGTSGNKQVFQSMASSGVSTVVGMHMTEEHRDEARKNHLNVVIAGHISSDTLGMNLLLDEVIRRSGQPLEVVECSGFRRIARIQS